MIIHSKKGEVFLRDNGFNNVVSDTHSHNKYTTVITSDTSIVMMPSGMNFNLSFYEKNPMQVYVNGTLETNNYEEIVNHEYPIPFPDPIYGTFPSLLYPIDDKKGIGIDFSPIVLVPTDIVIFEWVIDLNNIMIYRETIDCSTNPNFPAANINEIYKISNSGKIGGNLGIDVQDGDMIICISTTSAGDYATVGINWNIFNKV